MENRSLISRDWKQEKGTGYKEMGKFGGVVALFHTLIVVVAA
jgi:hypothetical protein